MAKKALGDGWTLIDESVWRFTEGEGTLGQVLTMRAPIFSYSEEFSQSVYQGLDYDWVISAMQLRTVLGILENPAVQREVDRLREADYNKGYIKRSLEKSIFG